MSEPPGLTAYEGLLKLRSKTLINFNDLSRRQTGSAAE